MKSFVRDKRFLKNVIIIVPKKDQDFVSKIRFIDIFCINSRIKVVLSNQIDMLLSNHGIITFFVQLHLKKEDRSATYKIICDIIYDPNNCN